MAFTDPRYTVQHSPHHARVKSSKPEKQQEKQAGEKDEAWAWTP